MTFKRVTPSYSGDTQRFGGDDINKYADLLSGITLPVDEVDINTNWKFRNNKLQFRNPSNTFSFNIIIPEITANRNISLPLLTGADEIVTKDAVQTITNKTINGNFTGINDASIDPHTSSKITITAKAQLNNQIVYRDQANAYSSGFNQTIFGADLKLRNAANTASINFGMPAIVSDITWTFPSTTDTFVGRNTTDTLTAKTLTNPAINTPTITNNGGQAITLPAGPETLVGRASTDTLTNKTIDASANTTPNILTLPSTGKKHGVGIIAASTSAANRYGILGNATDAGTMGTHVIDSEGHWAPFATGTTANTTAGNTWAAKIIARAYNFKFKARAAISSTSNSRIAIGVSSNTTIPTTDTLLGNTDFGVLIGFRTTDANWSMFNNDGSGAMVVTSLGVAKDTAFHTFKITADDTTPNFKVQLDSGTVQTVTTRIPATLTALVPFFYAQNSTTTSIDFRYNWIELESDK